MTVATKLVAVSRALARDAAVTIGINGGNVSHGNEEQIARFYDQAERVYAGQPMLWEHERAIIKAFLPNPPARILDVGCGGGRTTGYLAELGYRVTGIDLSEKLIASARRSLPGLDFQILNASNMTFPDDSFDAALFSHNGLDCVAPVALRQKILSEILRVVRPGGRFYLSSHNLLGKLKAERDGPYGQARWAYDWIHRLLRQVFRLNGGVFRGYWWYHDVDGWQLLYSATPRTNIQIFRESGWQPVAILTRVLDSAGECAGINYESREAKNGLSLARITRAEHHVQYVLEKRP